ncbi:hypothetical protein [Falsiroseomonas sp. HW251]|uniref:hypothetical protein n=1 Tax=Falsiroseomonas sp. HW251 TaxID=3390998 RepID=UPI003D31D451
MRGAIEGVTRNRIHGWIVSPDAPLAGRTVLAFLDEACIGAGKVEGVRRDLQEAGLGDGIAGFDFEIAYPNPADAARVTIRLEGSDAAILLPRARVMPPGSSNALKPARYRPSLTSLQWMRARGWLTRAEFEFLRVFRQVGACQRALPPGLSSSDAADAARSLLLLERMDEGALRRDTVMTPREWRNLAEDQELADGPGAVIALWSATGAMLPIIEGSHLKPPVLGVDSNPPTVPHAVGPDRLLFMDARTLLGPETRFPEGGLDAFYLAT